MRVICVGDSITYGQNVRADESWPAVLARLTDHDVRNEGVCGETTRLGLERFPKSVQLHHPDVVTIQYGHNDANCWESDDGLPRVAPQAYRANVAEMVQRARRAGAGSVLVLLPHGAPGRDSTYNERLADYLCAPPLSRPLVVRLRAEEVLDDGYGLHPNVRGHDRIARLVAAALP